MGTDATISIALIIAAVGFFITVYNFNNERKKDTLSEASMAEEIRGGLIKVNMKLDQLCGTTTDIKADNKAMQQQLSTVQTDMIGIKKDLEHAFDQIHELQEKVMQ